MRSIIYRDLEKSTFKIVKNGFTFVFSSEFYLNNFNSKIEDFIEKMEIEFKSRFGIIVDLTVYSSIVLYNQIEKRGFLIINKDGEVAKWLNSITLDGVIKMMKN